MASCTLASAWHTCSLPLLQIALLNFASQYTTAGEIILPASINRREESTSAGTACIANTANMLRDDLHAVVCRLLTGPSCLISHPILNCLLAEAAL